MTAARALSFQRPPLVPEDMTRGSRPLELFFRGLAASVRDRDVSAKEAVRRAFPGSDDLRLLQVVAKAATAPATTTTVGWAAELLAVTNAQWISSLVPAVYRQLAALGLQLSFDDGPLPRIPGRAATPTVAGSFIDEGAPFPVKQLALTASQTLKPRKLGVLTVFSREVASASQPNLELRDEIVTDTSVVVDSVLLSTTAATTAAPAGLRSFGAGLTATAGGGSTAMTADLKQLLNAISPASQPTLIVNGLQALAIAATYREAGAPALIMSPNVPAGVVVAIDAGSFVTASRLPSFMISEEPVIHMEDTSPLHISTGVQGSGVLATPSRSRCSRPTAWP